MRATTIRRQYSHDLLGYKAELPSQTGRRGRLQERGSGVIKVSFVPPSAIEHPDHVDLVHSPTIHHQHRARLPPELHEPTGPIKPFGGSIPF